MRKVTVQDICNNIKSQKIRILVYNWHNRDYEKVFEGNNDDHIPDNVIAAVDFHLWYDDEDEIVQIFVYDGEKGGN